LYRVPATAGLTVSWEASLGHTMAGFFFSTSSSAPVRSVEETYHRFSGRVWLSFGRGSNLTNDFVGCTPSRTGQSRSDLDRLQGANSVDGRPAVNAPTIRKRARAPRRRSSAICACSAMRRASALPCWC